MPDPRVRDRTTANARLFDAVVDHAVDLEQYKPSIVKKVHRILDDDVIPALTARLSSMLARIKTRGFDVTLDTNQGLRAIEEVVDRIVGAGFLAISGTLVEEMKSLAVVEGRWAVNALRGAIHPTIAVDLTTPSPELLRAIVTKRPFQGKHVRDMVKDLGASTRAAVKREINIGLAAGDSNQQILSRVSGRGGRLIASRRHAETVVRTATAHVTNHASNDVWRANQDVVGGVQWISTLDTRTSLICVDLDGQVWLVGTTHPVPPAHPRCRARTSPVLKGWEELGLDPAKFPPEVRRTMDGLEARRDFKDWLKDQSPSRQVEVLGKRRAELFRENPNMRFTDRNQRILSLDQLERRAG